MKASEKALMSARFTLSAMCRCERAPKPGEDGIGPYLHIPAYACVFMFVWIRLSLYLACQPVTHGFAATTLARAVSVPAGWQRGETLSAAHPGEEGLPARLLSHHLGPCVCGCPAPDPLGSSQCRRTSALSNLLVKRENNKQQTQLSYSLQSIRTAYSFTMSVRTAPIFGGSGREKKSSLIVTLNLQLFHLMYFPMSLYGLF